MKIYHYPSAGAQRRLNAIAERGVSFREKDVRQVRRILADVRRNRDEAVIRYTNQFDAPAMRAGSIAVTEKEFERAMSKMSPEFEATLDRAMDHIRDFHERQKPRSWISVERPGAFLGQAVRPVDAAGVYVPGGRGGSTPLVSSVLMGAIPARIAGVGRVCVATPPRKDGSVHPLILAAAKKTGVDAVYKAGGPWGIAALAYGTPSIPKVNVIVGPGNLYVTIAKKLVAGTVGIDMIAGPSEVLVIADETADPEHVAADLLSQAEHDPESMAVLLCTKRSVARRALRALERRIAKLSRREIAQASLDKKGVAFVVPDLETAADLANCMAPEHLELLVQKPFELFPKIRHAGAVFLGPFAPEPVGDYLAGPNHVLPTAGTARFSSALGVEHFVKRTSLIHYTKEALDQDGPHIVRLALAEGLDAHALSVKARLE